MLVNKAIYEKREKTDINGKMQTENKPIIIRLVLLPWLCLLALDVWVRILDSAEHIWIAATEILLVNFV